MSRFAIATLIALTSVTNAASAQSPTAPTAAAAPVTAQRPDLSPEAKARAEKFRAACGADLQTHCATIVRGTEGSRGEMRQCIETNNAKFSASCQAAVTERDINRDARKQAQPTAGQPTSPDKPKT